MKKILLSAMMILSMISATATASHAKRECQDTGGQWTPDHMRPNGDQSHGGTCTHPDGKTNTTGIIVGHK